MTRPLVIIVPGSKTKSSRSAFVDALLVRFYAYYKVQVEEDRWIEPLSSSFAEIPADTIVFEWSGGISPLAIRQAAHRLHSLLLKYNDRDIAIFAKSLGGSVAARAIRMQSKGIRTLIYVATPHFRFARRLPSSVRIVNISTYDDRYLRLANRALYLGMGTVEIPHALNILLPKMGHSDFNHNIDVEHKGKRRLFDIYKECIATSQDVSFT